MRKEAKKYLEGNSDTNSPDAGSSDISSDMKHRTVDGRDGSYSHSSRRHHSGFNSCCTAMWKANGKTNTLVLFLDGLFPKVWKKLWTCSKTDYYMKLIPLFVSYLTEITMMAEGDDLRIDIVSEAVIWAYFKY
jgi:hypothetical protein